jgi:hypothetical protein
MHVNIVCVISVNYAILEYGMIYDSKGEGTNHVELQEAILKENITVGQLVQ